MEIESGDLREILWKECMPIFKEVFGKEIDINSDDLVVDKAFDLFEYQLLPIYTICHSKEDVYDKTKKFTEKEVDNILFSFKYFVRYHEVRIFQEKIIKKYLPKKLQETPIRILGNTDYWMGYRNRHFIFQDAEKNKYHVKAIMDSAFYNKGSRLNEVFIYKLLELLGYGPRMQTVFVNEMETIYLINDDLANKEQGELNKQVFFWEASRKKFELPEDKKSQEHLVACNFLVDLLELADVYTNKANYGAKITSENIPRKLEADEEIEKIEKKLKTENPENKTEKMKMMIVDFHLILDEKPLKVEQFIEKYSTKVGEIEEQQTWILEDLVKVLNDKTIFERVVERLIQGKNGKLSFENALEAAFYFTTEISNQIYGFCERNDRFLQLREVFDLRPVEKQRKYYLERWQNLIKTFTLLLKSQ
mgnify:CR=1 FL=1